MKKITIDYSVSPVAISDRILGNQGEALATELEITLPDGMINDSSVAEFCGVFGSCNGVFHSKRVTKSEIADGVLVVPITAEVSSNLTVSFQVEAFSSDDSLIMKTSLIEGLTFNKSVCRNHSDLSKLIDPADLANITAEIKANTSARHTHENAVTLNKLGESNGSLTYDGKAVGGRQTATVTLDISEVTIDSPMSSSTIIFLGNTNKVPANAEIAIIELNSGTAESPVWIDLRDMSALYEANPYSLMYHKLQYNNTYGCYFLASILFPISNKNGLIIALDSGGIPQIRVTYYI